MKHKTFTANHIKLITDNLGNTNYEMIPVPPLAEQVATFCNENNIKTFTVVQLGAERVGIVY